MRILQAPPAPVDGQGQHGFRQRAEVIGDLLHADAPLQIARQRAKDFGMVRAAQEVEQRFLVVLRAGAQMGVTAFQFAGEGGGVKAFVEHADGGKFVDHTRVFKQVARRPTRCTQEAQQAGVDARALE